MSEEYITMREALLRDIKDLKRERDAARNLADAAMWEADRRRGQLWRARDRAWKLARERNHWKRDCLEQCKLLAMSADREEKLRTALRGLIVFTEEDQQFASPAYRKAFLRARGALQ